MARRLLPKITLQAQLVAVRRAASTAAVAAGEALSIGRGLHGKAAANRDALAAAALTLAQVQASREALDMLPDAQRDQLAIRLAAAGFRAVRVKAETLMPETAHV